MQDGAVVGRKKSDARIPSAQRCLSILTASPILRGLEQEPVNIHRCFLAFLSGTGLHIEFAVTDSKQTTAPFLSGARTPQFVPRTVQRDAHRHARTSIANALSNRELQLLEPRLIHRKQTIAPRSNRELSTNLYRCNSHAVIATQTFLTGLPRAFFAKGSICATRFLTGSRMQVEFAVTHSKHTTAPFLPGSRIVTKHLVSRIVFHPASSELFSTQRRISLQDAIAQPGFTAGSPRMHALVGRP